VKRKSDTPLLKRLISSGAINSKDARVLEDALSRIRLKSRLSSSKQASIIQT